MGCCSSGSHEPKQINNPSAIEESGDSPSPVRKILTWGVVVIVIAGLLAWLL